jgi:hypothetical protein
VEHSYESIVVVKKQTMHARIKPYTEIYSYQSDHMDQETRTVYMMRDVSRVQKQTFFRHD